MQLQTMLRYSYICDMIFITQFFKSNKNPIQLKGMALPEPELTQHRKPTFV